MLIPVNFLKGVSVPQGSPTFDFTINTTLVNTGSSAANQYKLPLVSNGIYNMTVDWGDGTSNLITVYNQPEVLHTYTTPGVYNIVISGTCNGWRNIGTSDRAKLLTISNWGEGFILTGGGGSSGAFTNNINLSSITATDTPKLTTSMFNAFRGCTSLVTINNIENWDVSSVTNMSSLFDSCWLWNDNVNNWDVSNVTNMNSMFRRAYIFNQPLNNWDVSNVTNMAFMFEEAKVFNQNINNWNVSSVQYMGFMFDTALAFNQPLNNWDTSSVIGMNAMFANAQAFNQSLNNWNTSNVTSMQSMFANTPFNQPLDNWDTSSVENMSYMFADTNVFNQPLNSWNTSNVYSMAGMFTNAVAFNQPLNNWNTSLVIEMNDMFNNAISFNQPLNNWDTTAVQYMQGMFAYATSFNSSVAGWNFSSVMYDDDYALGLQGMFEGATLFNQPINTWTNFGDIYSTNGMFYGATSFNQELPAGLLTRVYDMSFMFEDATAFNQSLSNQEPGLFSGFYADSFIGSTSLTPANLSTMYNSWLLNYNNTSVPDAFPYDSTFIVDTQYTAAGVTSRNILINDFNWTIVDGGLV